MVRSCVVVHSSAGEVYSDMNGGLISTWSHQIMFYPIYVRGGPRLFAHRVSRVSVLVGAHITQHLHSHTTTTTTTSQSEDPQHATHVLSGRGQNGQWKKASMTSSGKRTHMRKS